jgi:hypothetical protein
MPRITPGGLRVENFTCYDGDDLFQAICLFEKGLFPGSRPVLSAWPVDGTVVLRHAGHRLGVSHDVVARKSIVRREVLAIRGEGINRGVVKVVPPNRLFHNAMEALTFEIADEKIAPPCLLDDVLHAVSTAYDIPKQAVIERTIRDIRSRAFGIHILDKPEQTVKRNPGAAKRKAERKSLVRAESQVDGAVLCVTRALLAMKEGNVVLPDTSEELETLRSTLVCLRYQLKTSVSKLNSPEHATVKDTK